MLVYVFHIKVNFVVSSMYKLSISNWTCKLFVVYLLIFNDSYGYCWIVTYGNDRKNKWRESWYGMKCKKPTKINVWFSLDGTVIFITFEAVIQGSLKHCRIKKGKETRSFPSRNPFTLYSFLFYWLSERYKFIESFVSVIVKVLIFKSFLQISYLLFKSVLSCEFYIGMCHFVSVDYFFWQR